jgi:hypothetical protein
VRCGAGLRLTTVLGDRLSGQNNGRVIFRQGILFPRFTVAFATTVSVTAAITAAIAISAAASAEVVAVRWEFLTRLRRPVTSFPWPGVCAAAVAGDGLPRQHYRRVVGRHSLVVPRLFVDGGSLRHRLFLLNGSGNLRLDFFGCGR